MTGAALKPRDAALEALLRVDAGASPHAALEAMWAGTGPPKRDRALATELVYGALRRRNALDWALAHISKRPLGDLEPRLLWILRLGAYQLLYLDRVPPHAAVDEAVRLAAARWHKGITGFVNGVLRNLARRLADGSLSLPRREDGLETYLTVTESHPDWLVRRWLAELGPVRAESVCHLDNEAAPTFVRANRLKNTRDELADRLRAEGVTVTEGTLAPEGLAIEGYPSLPELASFREGRFFVQDEAAMLVAPLIDPRPGETIVDACSAPGGKATHLAELTGDRARVLAIDAAAEKLRLIAENCRRLGLSGVEAIHGDARRLPGLVPGKVDGALVDAPCSGLGVLRRRPDSRWRKRPEDPAALAPLQLALLDAAAGSVAPGGRIVYSTCTISATENDDVVRSFLAAHPEFRATDLRPYLPVALRDEPGAASGSLPLLPSTRGNDGFFFARFDRVGP